MASSTKTHQRTSTWAAFPPARSTATGSPPAVVHHHGQRHVGGNRPDHLDVAAMQGATLDIPINVNVVPLTPMLSADPGYLNVGMLAGADTSVTFTIANNGALYGADPGSRPARRICRWNPAARSRRWPRDRTPRLRCC